MIAYQCIRKSCGKIISSHEVLRIRRPDKITKKCPHCKGQVSKIHVK